MVLSYAFCSVSLMPVRSEPAHSSEMVNELLFGEKVEILEINDNDWARIHSAWDDYIGWCKISQLHITTIREYRKEVKFIADKHHNKLIINTGDVIIPMGANLFGMKLLYPAEVKYKGKKKLTAELELTPNNLIDAATQYMNAPYLWGGRSVMGIDCSGLTQMAFKMCGKAIRRDASQQAEEGELVDFLQNAVKGDLAFFENVDGKITHVGILVDNTHILHATDTSGRVVVDKIDAEGIVSILLRKRTHKLRMIRRYM